MTESAFREELECCVGCGHLISLGTEKWADSLKRGKQTTTAISLFRDPMENTKTIPRGRPTSGLSFQWKNFCAIFSLLKSLEELHNTCNMDH
jgi:hypothetical protein